MSKRIVVWGTGFVGRWSSRRSGVIRISRLVGVGVSDPEKVGRDAGVICGIGTDRGNGHRRCWRRIALRPDALRPLSPDGGLCR